MKLQSSFLFHATKMFSIKADNIFDVIKPIHYCSQLMGLTSFTIRKDDHQSYEGFVSLFNVMCIIISSCWIVFIVSWYILVETVWDFNQQYLSQFLESCTLVVLCFAMFITMFGNWWFLLVKNKLVNMFELIENVDLILLELGSRVNHDKHKKILVSVLLYMNISNVFGVLLTHITGSITNFYKVSVFSSMADFMGFVSFSLLTSQFIFSMWTIKIRYQHINEILKKNISNKVVKSQIPTLTNGNLRQLSIMHDKLLEISGLLSFCYGSPVSTIQVYTQSNFSFLTIYYRSCSL